MRSAEQFKEAILDVLEEGRWTVPTLSRPTMPIT